MVKIKSIRLLAYILDKATGEICNYLIINTELDAVTGVSFNQLYDMSSAVCNIKSMDKKTKKITFVDCASDKVPVVAIGSFCSYETVKDGVWVVGKFSDEDCFACYTQRGDKIKFSTKELIILYRQGILVNATVVQDTFIRGINWTIPVIEKPHKVKSTKTITKHKVVPADEYVKNLNILGLTIEMDDVNTLVTAEIVADSIKVPKNVEHKVDEIIGERGKVTYIKYVADSSEDAVKFLKLFLKGVKAEKVAVVLVDRADGENVSQVFIEATKDEKPVIKAKNDSRCAVALCKDTLDEILFDLAKYSLIDTYVNADIHKALKKIK